MGNAPSAPSQPGIAQYNGTTYTGCYDDSAPFSRALTPGRASSPYMSVEVCGALMAQYRYFGLEYGTDCYGGNNIQYSQLLNGKECSQACPGNPTQLCGGSQRLSIYQNAYGQCARSDPPPPPPMSTLLYLTATATPVPLATATKDASCAKVTGTPPSGSVVFGDYLIRSNGTFDVSIPGNDAFSVSGDGPGTVSFSTTTCFGYYFYWFNQYTFPIVSYQYGYETGGGISPIYVPVLETYYDGKLLERNRTCDNSVLLNVNGYPTNFLPLSYAANGCANAAQHSTTSSWADPYPYQETYNEANRSVYSGPKVLEFRLSYADPKGAVHVSESAISGITVKLETIYA